MATTVIASCTSTHHIQKDDLLRQIRERGRPVEVLGCYQRTLALGAHEERCTLRIAGEDVELVRTAFLNRLLRGREPGQEKGVRWLDLRTVEHLDARNRRNERVRISVDHNSQLIIKGEDGETTEMYLLTGAYDGQQVVGFRSVLLGKLRSIDVANIKSVELYSEFKRESKLE